MDPLIKIIHLHNLIHSTALPLCAWVNGQSLEGGCQIVQYRSWDMKQNIYRERTLYSSGSMAAEVARLAFYLADTWQSNDFNWPISGTNLRPSWSQLTGRSSHLIWMEDKESPDTALFFALFL